MAWKKAPKKLSHQERIAERDRKGREAAAKAREGLKNGGHMLPDANIYGMPTEAPPAPTMPKPHTDLDAMYNPYFGNHQKTGGNRGLTAQFHSGVAASRRDLDRRDRRAQDQPSDKGHPCTKRRQHRKIAHAKRQVNL